MFVFRFFTFGSLFGSGGLQYTFQTLLLFGSIPGVGTKIITVSAIVPGHKNG